MAAEQKTGKKRPKENMADIFSAAGYNQIIRQTANAL